MLYGWMEREFDAYKLSRSMYPSIFNCFPVIRTANAKFRRFHVPQPTFLFLLETPLRLSRNMFHGYKTIQCLPKPSQHVPIYLQQIPSYTMFKSMRKSQKNSYFTTFCFPLGTPLGKSRKTLHKLKDNSVLAEPLAACTHLSSTVSQLFEPQLQKVPQPTFLFSLETPLRLSLNMLHG